MIHNLALVFDQELHADILNFALSFQSSNECEFKYDQESVPHATLIKYDAQENPFEELEDMEYEVTLSGLTFLPSRTVESKGVWVEISVLIPSALRDLINEAASKLDVAKIQSEVGAILRPHITICKLRAQNGIGINNLNPELLRKSNVKAWLAVGASEQAGFAFQTL